MFETVMITVPDVRTGYRSCCLHYFVLIGCTESPPPRKPQKKKKKSQNHIRGGGFFGKLLLGMQRAFTNTTFRKLVGENTQNKL